MHRKKTERVITERLELVIGDGTKKCFSFGWVAAEHGQRQTDLHVNPGSPASN